MLHKANIIKVHKKPSNIFLKYVVSYMSMLIIPLLICSLYYSHSYKVIKNEAMERQHLALFNVKTQLDNSFNNLIQISTNLQINQQVCSFSYKSTSSPIIYQQINNLIDELSIFTLTNSYIKEIYIYFPESDYIVTSSTIYKYKISHFMPSRYISQETWQYLTDNLHGNSNQLLLTDHDKLLLARTLIINNKSNKPLSIIVFEINQNYLNTFLKSQQISCNFSALALTKNTNFLLSTNSDITQLYSDGRPVCSDNIKPSVTMYLKNKQKVNYIIDSVNLTLPDLNLVSYTEENVYNNETSNILFVLFISLFISILLGSIITCFYSIYNYRPIKEIMGYLKSFPSDSEEKNEYSKIKDVIIKTNSEIKTQRDLLKNNYLYKLLTGEIQFSEVSPTVAAQFHLNFTSDFSYIVLIRFSSFKLYDENFSSKDMKKNQNDLVFFIVQNILREIFQSVFPTIYFCYNQNETAMIVNISDSAEKKDSLLSEGLGTFITYCKNHFDIDFHVGISELCDNKQLSDAYTQASSTLEYMHLFGVGNLRHYNETPKESQISYLHLKTFDYIINLVMSVSEQALEDYFNNIYQELKQRNLSAEDAKSCLYFFYNVTMRLKAQLHYQYPYSSIEGIFVLTNQFFNDSLLDAIHYIKKLYMQAIQIIKAQNINSTDKKIHEVTQYIESNYFDGNLNLNSIAAHFKITPSYLSQKFRQKNGLSIIDYLYKIRISHSLVLIKDTSLKISEISQMVGFQDSNAFIRIFKKYHGGTPGNYKSAVSKSSS